MKLPELCMILCCIIVFFSLSLCEECDLQNSAQKTKQKNIKTKRSLDSTVTEKENGTKSTDPTRKKRAVSGKGSTCTNTTQRERQLIRELLKTIKDFQKYLKSKYKIRSMKLPSDLDSKEDFEDISELFEDSSNNEDYGDEDFNEEYSSEEDKLFDYIDNMPKLDSFQDNSKVKSPAQQPLIPQMRSQNNGLNPVDLPPYFDGGPLINRGNVKPPLPPPLQQPLQNQNFAQAPNTAFPQNQNPYRNPFESVFPSNQNPFKK